MNSIRPTVLALVCALGAVSQPRANDASPAAPASAINASTGTLTGTLKSVWLRKYSMIVYLDKVPGPFSLPVSASKPTLDQRNKRFVPHLLAVLKGTTIHYINHDDTKHNVYFIRPGGQKVNLGTGDADWWRDYRMEEPGVYAHRCNIHAEMSAYIVSFNHPYFALVQKRAGRDPVQFTLHGIPEGDYTVRVWCERFYAKPGHKFNRSWPVSIHANQKTTIHLKP